MSKKSDKPVRVRMAPSPTGFLHVGNLRTILYNYLFARKNNGKFLLRLDDTDQKREVEGSIDAVLNGLKWAGIEPDEGYCYREGDCGPYLQSERRDKYLAAAGKLLESGQAYYCFCSPERLEKVREECRKKKLPPRYDRHCANIPLEEARERIAKGEKPTIRFRLPVDREVIVHDLIRGEVRWHTDDLQDSVIVKSNGMALYHLSVVVDDHDMRISHILRSEEWLPSLPLHTLIFEALGYDLPEFAHLPMVLNSEGKKLSKRHDSVAVSDFIEKGVLPEAMLNFLLFLGWNPGDEREIFSLEEMIQEFSLERVHKAGAVFDYKKLENLNAHYIRQKDIVNLTELLIPYLSKAGYKVPNPMSTIAPEDELPFSILAAVSTVQERMRYLSEAPDLLGFYFQLPDYDLKLLLNEKMKVDKKIASKAIDVLIEVLENIQQWEEDHLREILLKEVQDLGWKNGQLLWPMRVALTGEQFSPGAFEVAKVLGKDETLRRLQVARKKLT